MPQKTSFKVEYSGEKRKKATVICTGFTNLLNQIWGIFVHILFYFLKTITHEMHAHMHKQLTPGRVYACTTAPSTNFLKIHENAAGIFRAAGRISRLTSALSTCMWPSVCEQSLTTQEMVASVSELSWSQVRSDQRLQRRARERGREGDGGGEGGSYLVPITFNHGKLAKCKAREIFMMRAGGQMSRGGPPTLLTSQRR